MGMIIVFFWFLYIAVAVGIFFIFQRVPSKLVRAIVLAILILIPTYDIIITNILGAYYCNSEPNPKTFIKKKVEYPISIYWNSSVTSGLNKDARKEMINKYLDGVHLKMMALNGDDGRVYVYHYENIPKEYYPLKKEYDSAYKEYQKYLENYNTTHPGFYKTKWSLNDKKVDEIRVMTGKMLETSILKEEIYSKATMPKMNYTVTFDKVKLNTFARKFLYAIETKIIDNNTKETIAYNGLYIHFWYNIMPNFSTDSLYDYSDIVCGERISIDDNTFDTFSWTK